MKKRGIDRLPVCFSVRWIRFFMYLAFHRFLSFFFLNTCFFFQLMLLLFFFQPEGKIRYRTRRIIASVFLIYRSASLYVMRYTFFFWRAVILDHSCKSVQSIFVRVRTQLLGIQEYMQSAWFFCNLYLLIILKLREPMHFFFEQQNNVSFSLLIANSTY